VSTTIVVAQELAVVDSEGRDVVVDAGIPPVPSRCVGTGKRDKRKGDRHRSDRKTYQAEWARRKRRGMA